MSQPSAVPQTNRNHLITCHKLEKSFGSRRLLSALDLTMEAGQSLAILGESGTGKSTLLHILAGLERPDSGQLQLDGTDLWSLTPSARNQIRRRRIGLVFQAFFLLPHLTARQNVALPWVLDGRHPDEERIDHLLEAVGLSHRADAKPAELSGGEQQRTAIARALALSPDIVLADEPTGNLDSRHAKQVLDLLLEQTSRCGHALVMVTHSQKAASRLQQQLWLDNGKLQTTPGS